MQKMLNVGSCVLTPKDLESTRVNGLIRLVANTRLGVKPYPHFIITRRHNELQDDQKVAVHLMITIQKDTSNVQGVPRQSLDIY
jgi:hypothetical protein